MSKLMKKIILSILLVTMLTCAFVVTASTGTNDLMCGAYRWYDGNDPTGQTYYDWFYCMDERESEIKDYYYIVHVLTGWDIPIIQYLEKISPEDLATMPPKMEEHFRSQNTLMFNSGYGTIDNGKTFWRYDAGQHIWINPEGNVYNGDLPPYQFLVWKDWEAYSDQLPPAPEGAPFSPPPYRGTPENTLPFAKVTSIRIVPGETTEVNSIEPPCPDAIYVNPMNLGDWDWTDEMKVHLMNIGLDTDMGKTRLGYEKSGTTINMVGMTPSGTMKEWTLKRSKGAWTCDSADAEELEDMLVILERIDAITGTALATPIPTVTEKMTLTSLKSLNLNKLDTNTLKGVNSSKQQSLLLSGQSTTASIPDRSELLSESGTVIQQKSLVSAKIAPISQKVRRSIGSA